MDDTWLEKKNICEQTFYTKMNQGFYWWWLVYKYHQTSNISYMTSILLQYQTICLNPTLDEKSAKSFSSSSSSSRWVMFNGNY